MSFEVIEAVLNLRLIPPDKPNPPVLDAKFVPRVRVKVDEVLYEFNFLNGAEELSARGRPTNRLRATQDASLGVGTIVAIPDDLRDEWLAEARQIAANLSADNQGGTTP